MKAITVKLKGLVPVAIERYNGTADQSIYDGWKGHGVEPYGRVIKGYRDKAPYDRDHISVRLAVEGAAAFSVVNLDEIDGPLDVTKLPRWPSYMGTSSCGYDLDNACGY